MTDAKRVARERTRLEAVGRFEDGGKNREIAAALRVSERSVERGSEVRKVSGRRGRQAVRNSFSSDRAA